MLGLITRLQNYLRGSQQESSTAKKYAQQLIACKNAFKDCENQTSALQNDVAGQRSTVVYLTEQNLRTSRHLQQLNDLLLASAPASLADDLDSMNDNRDDTERAQQRADQLIEAEKQLLQIFNETDLDDAVEQARHCKSNNYLSQQSVAQLKAKWSAATAALETLNKDMNDMRTRHATELETVVAQLRECTSSADGTTNVTTNGTTNAIVLELQQSVTELKGRLASERQTQKTQFAKELNECSVQVQRCKEQTETNKIRAEDAKAANDALVLRVQLLQAQLQNANAKAESLHKQIDTLKAECAGDMYTANYVKESREQLQVCRAQLNACTSNHEQATALLQMMEAPMTELTQWRAAVGCAMDEPCPDPTERLTHMTGFASVRRLQSLLQAEKNKNACAWAFLLPGQYKAHIVSNGGSEPSLDDLVQQMSKVLQSKLGQSSNVTYNETQGWKRGANDLSLERVLHAGAQTTVSYADTKIIDDLNQNIQTNKRMFNNDRLDAAAKLRARLEQAQLEARNNWS
jgi:hypothetical protein